MADRAGTDVLRNVPVMSNLVARIGRKEIARGFAGERCAKV
jgi:hypothetical protein